VHVLVTDPTADPDELDQVAAGVEVVIVPV